jgi:AcrR family transcriptional regulator
MVNTEVRRRRLSVDARRDELLQACLHLIGTRPWDEVSMAEVAVAAGVSKPLLYHYYATKSDLYRAAVRSAAGELREATRPDPALSAGPRLRKALGAYLDWVDEHALAYRAVLQSGVSSDEEVQSMVEEARADVVCRLAEGFGIEEPSPAQRIAFRGWVGFLEAACLNWLVGKDVTREHMIRLLATSVSGALAAADVGPGHNAT